MVLAAAFGDVRIISADGLRIDNFLGTGIMGRNLSPNPDETDVNCPVGYVGDLLGDAPTQLQCQYFFAGAVETLDKVSTAGVPELTDRWAKLVADYQRALDCDVVNPNATARLLHRHLALDVATEAASRLTSDDSISQASKRQKLTGASVG